MKKPIITIKALEVVIGIDFQKVSAFENVKIEEEDFSGADIEDLSLDKVLFTSVTLNQVHVNELDVTDSILLKCNMAGAEIEQSYFIRSEIDGTRMQGIQLAQARMTDFSIVASKINDANLRYAKLKRVLFEGCDMEGVDFIGAELIDVTFKNCNLTGVNFSQAALENVDLAGCTIENIVLAADAVKEVFVDTGQALYLSSIFGLKIRD